MKKIKMLVPILMLAMMFNAGIFMFSTDGNIAEAMARSCFGLET